MVQATGMGTFDRGSNNDSSDSVNHEKDMEKTLKIWQAVLGFIGLIITVTTIIVNLSNKVETQRLRIELLETMSRDHGLLIKEISSRNQETYNRIQEQLTQILLKLENKEDRGRTR